MKKDEIVLFETQDKKVSLSVHLQEETVWLSQSQMIDLFGRDQSVISRHINNAFKEELDKDSNMHFLHIANSDRPVAVYSLDVIISVGYRVKSQRGVDLMRRTQDALDSRQVLSVVERFSTALDLLDAYDHQDMQRPKGSASTYILTYEECRAVIDHMRFGNESDLFGKEKDGSFRGSIGNIYQSFCGQEIYPTLEEKAANLLYFVTKNHSFWDGNKRIAATMFLYFLDRNGILYDEDGQKLLDDHTLVALTIMIAESRPEEKEMMISVIMNCIG